MLDDRFAFSDVDSVDCIAFLKLFCEVDLTLATETGKSRVNWKRFFRYRSGRRRDYTRHSKSIVKSG